MLELAITKDLKYLIERGPNQANALILGGFKDDKNRDNPPPVDYVPCSSLIQELKRLSDSKLKKACQDQNNMSVNLDDTVDK